MTEELYDNQQDIPLSELKKQIKNFEPEGQEEELTETPKEEVIATPEATDETEGQVAEQKDKKKAKEAVEEPQPILGKFKTQEDLIKSYQELEKRSTKAEQRSAAYRDSIANFAELDDDGNIIRYKQQQQPQQNYQQPQQQEMQQPVNMLDQLEERYNRYTEIYGPIKAQILVQSEIAQASAQKNALSLDEMRADKNIEMQKNQLRKESDYELYEKEIDQYLGRMDLQSRLNPNSVRTLYWMVKGKNYKEIVEAKKQEAQLQTVAIEQQKEKAQVTTHSTKKPEEPKVNINKLNSQQLKEHFGLAEYLRY